MERKLLQAEEQAKQAEEQAKQAEEQAKLTALIFKLYFVEKKAVQEIASDTKNTVEFIKNILNIY